VRKIRRRVSVEKTLYFEYDISPLRAFLEKIFETLEKIAGIQKTARVLAQSVDGSIVAKRSGDPSAQTWPKATAGADKLGYYVPFKQSRLKGGSNPLRPPFHVETVLIGRALRQRTGYLYGIGFRIRDDGYVEAEFNEGIKKYDTYEQFEADIIVRMFGRPGK
jgi:hypothetical protein